MRHQNQSETAQPIMTAPLTAAMYNAADVEADAIRAVFTELYPEIMRVISVS